MNKKVIVFVVDDEIPFTSGNTELSLSTGPITPAMLVDLVENADWGGKGFLKQILSNLLNHDYAKKGRIEIYGFLHPEFCLAEIDRGTSPDVIIFDWEYGTESRKPGIWLLDIMKKTKANVFIYSAFRDFIPATLNKTEFDDYEARFKLFAKGEVDHSVFSSEDFLYQHVLNLVEKDNVIKMQDVDVVFESNRYLEKPSDIFYLEEILGVDALIQNLKDNGNKITEATVEQIFNDLDGKVLYNSKLGFLISTTHLSLIDKFNPDEEISYLEVMRKFGIIKLKEVIDVGLVRV